MKLPKPKRTRLAGEDTRDKMLLAAIQVFTESGYKGASIRSICRQAGVNVAMVRYHFGNKRSLYREVIQYVADADAKKELFKEAARGSATPEDALRLVIHTVFRRLIARTGYSHIRLVLNELANPSSAITDEIQTTMRPLYNQLRTLVASILKLPVDDPRTHLSSQSVLGQMMHYVHARPLLARVWPEMRMSPDQIEMIADHIADFSVASLQAAQPKRKTRTANQTKSRLK